MVKCELVPSLLSVSLRSLAFYAWKAEGEFSNSNAFVIKYFDNPVLTSKLFGLAFILANYVHRIMG